MSKHGNKSITQQQKAQQQAKADSIPMTPGRLLSMQGPPTPVQQPMSSTKSLQTEDSFGNMVARLGNQDQRNQISHSYYNLGPFISRNHIELEAMYRSSWLVGQVVDVVGEDMTREGISMHSEMKPDDIEKLQVSINEFDIWQSLCSTIKWARLYGGAIAVMLIDGADYSKPLDVEKIRKDQFKGLVVLDRWMIQPSMGELVTEVCKDMGKPKFYETFGGVTVFPEQKIHYTRVIRFDGIELPYFQKLFENLWGLSVVERMLDRLIAFDSATQGGAQLLYKAYLRVIKFKGLRQALANSGRDEQAIIKHVNYINMLQGLEGITVLDGEDEFDTHQYTFSGIPDLIQQFGMQVSGATGIPLVRLFGQSPAGLNSTGESDLRNYYDRIKKDQENQVRPQLGKLIAVMEKSRSGKNLPEDFQFSFKPLWQLSEMEKSQIATQDAQTQSTTFGSGVTTKATALKELRQQSEITGRFTNITAEEIKDAEDEPPPGDLEAMLNGMGGGPGAGGGGGEVPENPDGNEPLGGQNPDLLNEKGKEKGDIPKTQDSVKKKIRFKDALRKLARKYLDADFKEEEHPRANSGEHGGEFVKKGASEAGEKKKSQTELIYEDLDENAKKKYQRITSLRKQFDVVWKENASKVNKDERAACLALIMKTGIRPGSDKDNHAKKKAYGATTLEGRHIVEEDGDIFLRYVGKKGVDLNIPVSDPAIAKMLLKRKKKVGNEGRIFNTSADKLSEYSHSLDGKEFKTKDFRTHVGTSTAIELLKNEKPPSTFQEYKKKVMLIAKGVSQRLGNTPVVALQAYIDPRVFSSWREGIRA
jgi:hypothetical protein